MSDITLMLQAVARGERQASFDLLPLVYEELRQLAATRMALVDVLPSPALGSGAVWTSTTGPLVVEGGNYKMTIPASGNARFFRLQK